MSRRRREAAADKGRIRWGWNADRKGSGIDASVVRGRRVLRNVRLGGLSAVFLLLALAGCSRTGDEGPAVGYRAHHGDLEVFAVTPPERFVGRTPSMPPERVEQEEVDAVLREEHPEFFAATDPPPVGTRSMAEFEPVDAVYVAFDADIEQFTEDLIRAVLPVAPVLVTLTSGESPERFREFLQSGNFGGSAVRLINVEHDNFWTRDFGPVSVELPDGQPAFLDFIYPQTRVLDDGLPSALAVAYRVPVFRVPLKMEGGVFMTNGDGLCVTTTSLAVANAELPFELLTHIMERVLGCRQLVFLESPADEATGHVDMIAKFTSPDTILVGDFDPVQSPADAETMDRNARLLSTIRVGSSRKLRVVRIPMPAPEDGVYQSYTNSLLVNGTAVVPTYDRDPKEEKAALDAYRRALPDHWRIETVISSEAIVLGGAVHCAALELRLARND